MTFFYCFANASLTQRVVIYLLTKLQDHLDSVTVIFLNDFWIMRVVLASSTPIERRDDSLAVLNENGIVYRLDSVICPAFRDLDQGYSITDVMNRHQLAIVSHGAPAPSEIRHFQEQFVTGLGYCPQSLV
ncbi:MAG: hypothetical protein WBA10_16545 [Elainellaceae cyanobacterium]